MPSLVSCSAIVLASSLFLSTARAFQTNGNSNLAVYWGQGASQQGLAHFCEDSTIDIIPIAFLNVFPDENGTYGYPGTNFGNACGGYYVDPLNQTTQFLASCPQIESDITYCQQRGKKILLSLGGGASGGVFVADDDSAVKFADFIYGAFGPPSSSWTGPRPFGSACIDGFDFDIEASASLIPTALGAGYATMVNHLRTLGPMLISATPQCVIPDANLANAIANSFFDFIFVQFYNTPQCSARAYFNHTYGSTDGESTDISFSAWVDWVQANSKNPNAPIYLGLPASPAATFGDMYMTPDEANTLIEAFRGEYPNQFGGVMLWEATFSENNQINGKSYAQNIKCFLTGRDCPASTSSTSSTTSATTTTTATPATSTSTTTSYTGHPFPHGGSSSITSPTTWPTGSPASSTAGPWGSNTDTSSGASSTANPWDTNTDTSSGAAASSSTSWGAWDPASTTTGIVSAATTGSSSTSWGAWDPTSTTTGTVSAVTTGSSSTSWGEWDTADPTTTTTATATSTATSTVWGVWDSASSSSPSTSSSTDGWVWHFSSTTSVAPAPLTVTVMPLPATSSPASIASWSSTWTTRAPFAAQVTSSSLQGGAAGAGSASTWTASPSFSSSYVFTGYSKMPASSAVAAGQATSVVSAAGWGATGARPSPSMSAYANPNSIADFTGAAPRLLPPGVLIGLVLGVAAMLL